MWFLRLLGGGKRRRSEEEVGASKRQATEKRKCYMPLTNYIDWANIEVWVGERSRDATQTIIHTRPHDGQRSFTGGERVKLQANYFRLLKKPTWNIYKYHVTFEPECMMSRLRNALIMQHKSTIGGFLFDGTQLFVTRSLNGDKGVLQLTSKTRTDEVYTLTLQFTKGNNNRPTIFT